MFMKKACIITLYGNSNYGNKLQNYAVQEIINKRNIDVLTVENDNYYNDKKNYILRFIKRKITIFIKTGRLSENYYYYLANQNKERTKNFLLFDKMIKKEKKYFNYFNQKKFSNYDYYFVGSDQIWNPYFGSLNDFGLVNFVNNKTKIGISASIGINNIPNEKYGYLRKSWNSFKSISVREEKAKEIIEEITGRKDIVVLLDPTMLLTIEEWDKIIKKPSQIDKLCCNGERYILNYFLGNLSESRKKEIEKVANENNCKIINILDKNSSFYECGPSEFVWLEKNAFLICTDSFHSTVFSILYKRPFIVFNREDGQIGKNNMNSRLETLLSKFKLEDRYYNGKITKELLKCDFKNTDKVLLEERTKADKFLIDALK